MPQQQSPGAQEVLAVALSHHQAGRLSDAERLYRQILEIDPNHVDALHFLGVLAHQAGRNDVAVDLIGKAIARNGRVPFFHNNLGNALKAQGKLEEAVASYRRALALVPDYFDAHYNLGTAFQLQGRLEEAAASYGRALILKPDHAQTHSNLGNALQAQGKLAEAAASYGRALAHKPDYAEAHNNLGIVLNAQGKPEEAIACYRRALTHKPNHSKAHNNLGIVLLERGKPDEAADCFGQALFHESSYAEAHNNLAHALREQGKLDDAVASFGRALALSPDYAEARLGLAIAGIPIVSASSAESTAALEKFRQSLEELTAWSTANPGKLGKVVGSNQPFYLAYRPGDVSALLSRYGDLVCAAAAAHWQRQTDERRTVQPSRDRIRMVVVSGHVRQHPVWEVITRGFIGHMDRQRFEIFLYHTGSIADAETVWARAHVDRFVAGPKPTQAWLDEIARDQPDIVFYPELGMDTTTCVLAALRLAPLQVAGWGHPVTTGLPSMDWFLSAELLEPPGAQQHYRERLVRLPGTGVCTEWAVRARKLQGPPRPENTIRFALCQQPIKFDPADDVLLTRIARTVGPSEFWLASPKKLHWATTRLHARLAAAFRAEGLDPEAHLRVMPWLPQEQFAGFLDDMDVYLDCPAFSGYTTAWQAVHRGLPVVTLEGEFLRQRLAAGLLRQIGMTDGIASSREQYVEIAVRWAQECRQSDPWAARREALRRAADKADGNRSAVTAFEQMLIEAVQGGTSRPGRT
jgi:protein O-GlcNAc transferase